MLLEYEFFNCQLVFDEGLFLVRYEAVFFNHAASLRNARKEPTMQRKAGTVCVNPLWKTADHSSAVHCPVLVCISICNRVIRPPCNPHLSLPWERYSGASIAPAQDHQEG